MLRELLDYLAPTDAAGVAAALAQAAQGDGHPVLVLPALLKSDKATAFLRHRLARLGYEAHGWDLGTNIGPTDRALDGSEHRLRALHQHRGRRVSVIGHSMGGLIAREIAKRAPGAVRQVITLCSPIQPPIAGNVELIFRLLSPWHSARLPELWAGLSTPLRCRPARSTPAPTASCRGRAAATSPARSAKASRFSAATRRWRAMPARWS
ncbi:MAG: alpha/beta fold hydrolase [Pseudomonadota bacterium]